MQNLIGKIYTNCIYIILLILLYDVQNGFTQLNPYFQFIPQNDNLHTKIYDYSKGFDEDHFTYELQYPIPIYETLIKKITIRKNGLLALDSISDDNLPSNYPVNTSITNQRLQDFDGRYLSIFSSVNDGKCGRISVTEIDLLSPSKLPCVERMQIDRLIKFIHLSYIEESELKAQYIVHILWENMTNAYLINQKANTYGMIIISNGIRSYAFMQYIKIEWNENDVAENLALPPESGIFMRPFGGYQLPRSSQAVEPNIWLTETNIALHGEWLVPLYKSENIAKINVKNLSAVASEFVTSLTSVCEGSLHSHKSNNETPSDTVVIKNVNIDNTSEELIARTQSFKRALESFDDYDLNVSSNDYSYGMTENVPKAAWNILSDETEFSGVDPINQNEVNILPENETGDNFYHESNQFVVDNKEYTPTDRITTQTYHPLGRYDGDEERQEIHEPIIAPVTIHPLGDDDDGEEDIIDNKGEYKSVNETFSNSLVKCDAVSECNSHNTECYRVDNSACCVCSDGFYGAGDAKCWSEVNDHKFSFSGSLITRFGIENTSSPLLIYLDIQHGSLRRSSSGIRGGRTNDRIYSTMRLITPVFHILNSMVSSPCENIPKRERLYNLFTLGNGLQRPFKVLFQFDIERVGKFTIQAVLELHDFTTGAYASGVIQLEAFSTESLNLLDQSYIEAYSASDKPDKTYYANYKIDDHGRVVFPEQTVKFIVEHRDSNEISNFPEEINVRWSAVAESESCLLKQVSSIPRDKSYYIRLKDRGYCSEDCSSPDGTCNLFCVDEPLLLATEPSPCDCVTCDRHGEVCRPEGASYRCECGQGLKLMPDNTCQATSLMDVTNYLGVQCGSVNCHTHARCIDPNQAFCQCLPGYRGDGVSHCESDPCSKCRRNEICENGICIASGVDLCEGIQCGEQAFCQDGACVCTPGYTGDPVVKCYEERDPCSEVRCHPYAKCRNGNCECLPDYYGDGYHVCKPRNYDLCRAEQCHQFARCVEGQCRCLDGYEGDGYQMCNIIPGATSADCGNCNGIPFKEIAQCVAERCVCARGFIEVQAGVCMECVQDNCHQDAVCRPDDRFNGAYSCHCKAGFTGDGVSVCKPESVGREDATSSHAFDPTCGGGCRIRNAECDRYTGTCKCRSGYDGDGERGCYWNCKLCHPSAICDRENERCICPSGYRGDGQTFCEQIPVRQDSIKVRIMGEGEVMHITDISHPLELRCFVTGSDQSYSGQWIQPHSAQEPIVTKTRQQDGYEISLRINQPTITDSGRYECRAGNVAAFIDVNVEESAIPFTVLLTSDDGILMTQSTDSNVTKATLWNIAENNKYGRVSMVGDCNSQRIIYTSDYGHTIRWGNSNSGQNKLVTKEIYTSQFNRFRNLAVDSLSGNVFAWEEAFGKIMVFNPNKPNIHYTLESLHSLTSSEQQNFAGLALHSTLGLMYWAIYTDGWRPNGTIQVASMSGENEEQLLQLTGEPLAISISPATPVNGNSAGKLCWMQRSSKGMFGLVTELHCARLGQTGREILTNEKIREFSPSEEPSFGMTQYKGTLLWTDASKTVYYSINPDRRIRVRYVCCSNRFQALSVLGDCPQASTNPCTYSNGRCRYICLPNDGGRSRTCVCPDNEPGCHKEM
ncbi:unnamed protein product [Schistosoma intercalatum]|nr:unnamed protein product [Schistosoma intercalatum]